MIRGTTPTHTFGLPVRGAEVTNIRITYRQNDENVLEKTFDDVSFSGNKVIVELTQEETFRFKADVNANVKIRALTKDGKVVATKIPITIDVEDSYNEEILT